MLFRKKKNKIGGGYSPTEYIRLTNEEYEALEKMKKVTRHRCLPHPEFELHSHRSTTVLFEEMKNKQLEDEEYLKSLLPKGKKFTREDLIAECREKYPTFDLAPCCCCGSEAKIIFRFYDTKDGWGFPAGYAIECCIHCSQCEHMFDYILVFKDDYDSIEKCVNEYCARWNLLNTARHKSVVSACYGSMGVGRNVKLSELEDKPGET